MVFSTALSPILVGVLLDIGVAITGIGVLFAVLVLLSAILAKAGKERAERQLRLIEAALKRIDNDEFGECMECGEPINPKRLEIDPTCLYCIDCAR